MKKYIEISRRLNVSPDVIGRDGIKFRGRGPYISETGYWGRESGNEIAIWKMSNLRLLEITKDLNDEEVWDIRSETGLKNHSLNPLIGNRWYQNLMRWEFLLFSFFKNNICPEFKSLNDSELINSFNNSVSARINCKKTVGGGCCPNTVLNQHIALYGDLIIEQITELNPNVIFIGGCSNNIILDKIVRKVYPTITLAETTGWIYYSVDAKVVVINGYNPGIFTKTPEDSFNSLKKALRLFAGSTAYKEFINILTTNH